MTLQPNCTIFPPEPDAHNEQGEREDKPIKRQRLEDYCDQENKQASWRGRAKLRAMRTEDRRAAIDNLKPEVAQQVQLKNSRIPCNTEEKGDEHGRGDHNDRTSSARAPPRINTCMIIKGRRKDEAECINRLIS